MPQLNHLSLVLVKLLSVGFLKAMQYLYTAYNKDITRASVLKIKQFYKENEIIESGYII